MFLSPKFFFGFLLVSLFFSYSCSPLLVLFESRSHLLFCSYPLYLSCSSFISLSNSCSLTCYTSTDHILPLLLLLSHHLPIPIPLLSFILTFLCSLSLSSLIFLLLISPFSHLCSSVLLRFCNISSPLPKNCIFSIILSLCLSHFQSPSSFAYISNSLFNFDLCVALSHLCCSSTCVFPLS